MMISKRSCAVLPGLLVLYAVQALAAPVTFSFTGRVNSDAINGCGVLVNCGVVTGSYTFDSAAPDLNPDPTAGLYAATNITFSIDGVPFFSAPVGFINVANFPGTDQYGLLATGVAANLSPATLSILLTDRTGTAFNSDALPLNPGALTPLLPGTFQLNATDDTFQLLGSVDRLLLPPAITKAFGSPGVPLNGSVPLIFSISNPNPITALTGVQFTDTLPAGLAVSTPNGLAGTCGGIFIAVAGSNGISLSGTTLAANSSCTLSVNVTGTIAGVKNNVSGNVTSANGGAGNFATATVNVVAPPVISKSFVPVKVLPGSPATVSFSITNPNSFIGLTGVSFIDALPAGLLVSSPATLTSSCGGIATATPGAGTISLTGGTISISGTCVVTASVVAVTDGIVVNSVTVTSTNGSTGNTANATLLVATPPSLSKSFGAVSAGVNNTTALTFTLTNLNRNVTLHGLQFSDPLPAGLVVSTPANIGGTCNGGTVIAPAGATLITFGGGTLVPQTSCTLIVNVTATGSPLGYLTNTTSNVTSNEALPGAAASATIFVGDPFQISYAANLSIGDSFVDITNSGTSGAGLQSGTAGSITGAICANIYLFTADEQLAACCSCPVTPNGLVSFSPRQDAIGLTLTPAVPTALVIKVLATAPVAGSCVNSAAGVTAASLVNGMKSFGTTIHAAPVAGSYGVTEKPFSSATLGAGELNRLGTLCNFILANGSGFGVCRSCRLGGLGAERQ